MKTPWKKIISIAILASVAIAMGLNIVLQLKVFDFDIIGKDSDEGAPQVWLMFWGTLSAAVATCIMAYVSHKQNKDILDQTKLLNKKADMQKLYDSFEEFLGKCEDVYSLRRLVAVLDSINDKNPNSFAFFHQLDKLDYSVRLKKIQVERFCLLLEAYPEFKTVIEYINEKFANKIYELRGELEQVRFLFNNGRDDKYSNKLDELGRSTRTFYNSNLKDQYETLLQQGNQILEEQLKNINKINLL